MSSGCAAMAIARRAVPLEVRLAIYEPLEPAPSRISSIRREDPSPQPSPLRGEREKTARRVLRRRRLLLLPLPSEGRGLGRGVLPPDATDSSRARTLPLFLHRFIKHYAETRTGFPVSAERSAAKITSWVRAASSRLVREICLPRS